jgi:hypothetical protein
VPGDVGAGSWAGAGSGTGLWTGALGVMVAGDPFLRFQKLVIQMRR